MKCECGLETDPPIGVLKYWHPDLDDDPGPPVTAVVRYGEDPTLRRAVRDVQPTGESGWREYGAMVDYYHALTPPMQWKRVGNCWAGAVHPVVAVIERPGGHWEPFDR